MTSRLGSNTCLVNLAHITSTIITWAESSGFFLLFPEILSWVTCKWFRSWPEKSSRLDFPIFPKIISSKEILTSGPAQVSKIVLLKNLMLRIRWWGQPCRGVHEFLKTVFWCLYIVGGKWNLKKVCAYLYSTCDMWKEASFPWQLCVDKNHTKYLTRLPRRAQNRK